MQTWRSSSAQFIDFIPKSQLGHPLQNSSDMAGAGHRSTSCLEQELQVHAVTAFVLRTVPALRLLQDGMRRGYLLHVLLGDLFQVRCEWPGMAHRCVAKNCCLSEMCSGAKKYRTTHKRPEQTKHTHSYNDVPKPKKHLKQALNIALHSNSARRTACWDGNGCTVTIRQ